MAEVVLDRVSKRYLAGGPLVVRDFSLRVRDGELVVLVGPSGCGKSTVLRMIAGLEAVTGGDISIDGRNVNAVSPRERDIAMVFQDSALYPHMTVHENLAFALRMRNVSKPEIARRVEETARLLGMTDLLARKPSSLSGGQRQRLALGRAAVRVPEANCLLFDEPLSNLDAGLRNEMRREIKCLHQRLKATMIHVTHDQEEAMTLGDRLIVMAEGRVQQDGSPMEVYRRPRNRFVAGFIGSPAMNFIAGKVECEGGRVLFVEHRKDGARIELPIDANASKSICAGAEMVLGVRPERVSLARETASVGDHSLRGRVRSLEHRGNEVVVHMETTPGDSIIARMPTVEALAAGDVIQVRIDPRHLHVFQPGPFGERIASPTDAE
jgi:ABC-type sugar transport system ATPase subunit